MKCTNKLYLCILLSFILLISGCSTNKLGLPYTVDSKISSFEVEQTDSDSILADAFASALCVSDSDISNSLIEGISDSVAAGLFDIDNCETLYSKNVHETVYPASLTKIMTAIVAIKNSSMEQILTASQNVKMSDPSAQVIGLKAGDQMTMEQALNILLIYSANDVAIMIAENVAGSVEDFVVLMNDEAQRLGATHTHFANPHGLSDENHYTSLYDLYLITNEAIKFDTFNNIIHTAEYTTSIFDAAGNSKEISIQNTNQYLNGATVTPSGITIIGGKTGTTNAAGHCLILVSKNQNGNKYISIIMKSASRDEMYTFTNSLLDAIS